MASRTACLVASPGSTKRQADAGGGLAEQLGGVFTGAGLGFQEQGTVQRAQPVAGFRHGLDVAVTPGAMHLGAQPGGRIGGH